MAHIVFVDNRDSFVYNLLDAASQTPHRLTVFRNSVAAETILASQPDLIILSPGPGHPREAGSMMELVERALGRIPILGVCLGFQALLEHHGGVVAPCGPEHGRTIPMRLSDEGINHPVFAGLVTDRNLADPSQPGRMIPVARYHSLGCVNRPEGQRILATTPTQAGDVIMAAESLDGMAMGFQFHPESILSPTGPVMLARSMEQLLSRSARTPEVSS